MNLSKLVDTFRAYRAGAPLGDVVVLKLDALSAATPAVEAKLASLRGYAPTVDLAPLRALPAGTLGREYARFMDANGLTPLVVSDDLRRRFRDSPYALRFTATHDLHHVLAGFDSGLAGEIGVAGFNVGQGSAPVGHAMFAFACFLYMIVSPTQARAILHNARLGLAMGRRAQVVIAAPIESSFERPLDEVRRELAIPDPREAGVLPSGKSVIAARLSPQMANR